MNIKRLMLESVNNVRDIGGYPIDEKSMTKWGVFLRSADLTEISSCDMDVLYNYGIKRL